MGYGVIRVVGKKAELITLGAVDLHKLKDHYLTLKEVFNAVTALIEKYLPDEMAIEAPFFGKNVQSMLKLGRAQGVAIAAAIERDVPISEYEPRKVKVAITGNGAASKEQVAGMLMRLLKIPAEDMNVQMDATDALGVAYCHYLQMRMPQAVANKKISSWKDFANKNKDRITKRFN
jgi:crossover junction endodeoxyribonuclease RuvC